MMQGEIDFPEEKYCKGCGRTLNETNRRANSWNYCKPCDAADTKKLQAEYRKANKDPNKVWDPNYTKLCRRCNQRRNAEQFFSKNCSKKDGYRGLCKICLQAPKEKYRDMRIGAKKRGYEWSLNEHDTSSLFLSNCYYCGKPSIQGVKVHGLDRVNNDKGYHIDNIVTCCEQCNISKHKQTQEDFIEMCKRVAQRHATYEKSNMESIKIYLENNDLGEFIKENFDYPVW